MSNVLYVDATFDKVTHLSFAGYCDIFSNGRVFSKKFKDSNQAELFALRQCVNHCKEQLAMQRDTPLSFTIFADSQRSVDEANNGWNLPAGIRILHIPREKNIADAYIRVYKEHHNVCKTDITPTAKAQSQKKTNSSH